MTELDCQETKRQVHEFLHNELNESEIEDITAHLANCDSCEADYDMENLINGSIKEACDEAPPEELASRVLAEIRRIQANGGTHSI
jgi:anti-sigma factor (TIGR02949 family)